MLVSYNWLNKYFDGKLPVPEAVEEALTFHAWEIESVEKVGDDTVLDVKVLPDKAMWALSHRGVAKDISVILDLPLAHDPLQTAPRLEPTTAEVEIKLDTLQCRRFAAALITGVKVGPSPDWLRQALEAVGQRSINNIVDASNYVMFDLGQPSHAFDARLVGAAGFRVRQAREGEGLVSLDEKEYVFTPDDTVIARGDTDEVLSIAGLKGGKHSGIGEDTTDVIVEVANWDPVGVRRTGQRLRLRTDASARYENGIVPEMIPFGLAAVSDLIVQVAGGKVAGYADISHDIVNDIMTVSVGLAKINSVLGLSLTTADVEKIIRRFGWQYQLNGEIFVVTPPTERTDLRIPEDLIEEIGRVYGYEHVEAIVPEAIKVSEINKRFYYTELIRETLLARGFSEIFTSSFRERDEVKLANAFAADKGYLRSHLTANMKEALAKNAPHADLLGLRQVRIFEIGTVFDAKSERFALALGAQSPAGYKAKADDPVVTEAVAAISDALELDLTNSPKDGIAEFDLGELLAKLPDPEHYQAAATPIDTAYQPFSVYPAIARDIALWAGSGTASADIAAIIQAAAGPLCLRITLFDEFQKDERTSYAYRLVFQSKEKTLTDSEVNAIMDGVYQAVAERGFETR